MRFGIFLLFVLALISCEKEEQPIEVPEQPGELQQRTVNMYPDYRDQVWFNLASNTEVYRNPKINWDIVWSADGKIRLNTSKAVYAGVSRASSLSEIEDTVGIKMRYDVTTGNPDSTAFSVWGQFDVLDTAHVYLLDMGYDSEGSHLGVKKLKITLNESSMDILWGDWKATSAFSSFSVTKQEGENIYISLENGIQNQALQVADWDIVFTQYVHVFYDEDPVLPYLVTGVLSNPERVEVAELDSSLAWEEISLADAEAVNYSRNVNVIGYDWKDYSFDTRGFTVFPWKMYLLKVADEKVYKLRFLDFYNGLGEKGNPLFEYQKL